MITQIWQLLPWRFWCKTVLFSTI